MLKTIKDFKARTTAKIILTATMAKNAITDRRGSVSEHAIVIIIGVVLGGLLLTGLIALMSNTIMPSTESKVESMFNM